MAVWLDDVVDLDSLRRLSAQALNRLWHDDEVGVAHHPFLQQHDDFVFDSGESLHHSRIEILYDRQVK